MTTRLITREFIIKPGYITLPTVSNGAWFGFMNTYAVWPLADGDSVTIRRSIVLQAGNYFVTGAADDSGSVSINGQNITLYSYTANIDRGTVGNSTVVNHPGGTMSIVISATSTGGPRGVAVTISEYKQDQLYVQAVEYYKQGTGYINNPGPPYVGALVWSTRSPSELTSIANYQIIMPFNASVTAYAWGAGGGGGGATLSLTFNGGDGSHGLYNVATFPVEAGDTLEVFLGSGGGGGYRGEHHKNFPRAGQGGNSGTQSRINVNGNSAFSFNGGLGGNAGFSVSQPSGQTNNSGGGGGGAGGGASGILKNNVPVLIAGGGGGGGGAGYDQRSGYTTTPNPNGSILNNATGQPATDYRGEDGQNAPQAGSAYWLQYGGGGGGAGGGYPGGQGGRYFEEYFARFRTAFPGQCGGNLPPNAASTGQNSPFYKSGYAAGGLHVSQPAAQSLPGQDGRVVLKISPISLGAIKVNGEWRQISEEFVKIDGQWRDISRTFIKIDDTWHEISGTGQGDILFANYGLNYGRSTRSFS